MGVAYTHIRYKKINKYYNHTVTAATTAVAVSQAAVFGAIGVIVLIELLIVNEC
jgi:hypothetical protein